MKRILFTLITVFIVTLLNAQETYTGVGSKTTGGTLDWNDPSNTKSGSGHTLLRGNALNGPYGGTGNYFHPFNFEYSKRNGSGNITQLAIPYGYGPAMNFGIKMRGRYAGQWTPWVKILSENSNGNVGIGTDNPTAALEVQSDDGIKIHSKTGAGYRGTIKMVDGLTNTTSRDDMHFGAAGGFVFEMDQNKNGVSNIGGFNVFDRNDKSVFMIQESNGNVGIGTTDPKSFKLGVNGKIAATEVKVAEYVNWPDFVFEDKYNLPSLKEVENHINPHYSSRQ